MSSSNKVLLVGGPKVGKKYILQSTRFECGVGVNSLTVPAEILEKQSMTWKDTSMEHIQLCQWLVDNKYYTAHLDFWTVSTAKVATPRLPRSSTADSLPPICRST